MRVAPKIWGYRLVYMLLGLLAIAYPLLPLQFTPARLPAPDLLYVLTMAWIVRQPESAPFILVAALALLSDAVLMRPLGLWAMLFLISSETLRLSHHAIQERGLLAEFSVDAGLLVLMVVLQNIILWISFSQTLDLASSAQFVMLTLASTPVMILFLHYIIRVRKPDTSSRPDRLGKIK